MRPAPIERRVRVDINADLGEREESIADGTEKALLECVTSANIACGAHAGSAGLMERVARLALDLGRRIGAHPGYPDRVRFGRTTLPMTAPQLERSVREQVLALGRIVRSLGGELSHVKPHGALYHRAMADAEIAGVIASAAAAWSRDLVLVGRAGAPTLGAWRSAGFVVWEEAFADRTYEPDGSLRDRALPGALITDPARAAAQALRIARGEGVEARSLSGRSAVVAVRADTIGVHSDTPGAVAIARAVSAALNA